MTVAEMIKSAARAKGAIDRYNDLDAYEYAEGLAALNSMLALWAVEGITVYNVQGDSFPLVPGKAAYTIGPAGADVIAARPADIYYAFVRTANGLDIPVEVITDEEYDAIPAKTISYRPDRLQYKPAMPLGIITVYPVPSAEETLYIQSTKPLGSFTSIEDEINLAPEMDEAIRYNLALRICPEVPPTQLVLSLAATGKSAIYTVPVAPASFEPAVAGGSERFNVYRGF